MEKGGSKIKDMISVKNPFKKKKCSQKTCPLCAKIEYIDTESEKVGISCNANNVGYRWICITCEERNITKVYEGETGRSARIRGAEHVKEFQKKKEKSVLYKHKLSSHNHEKVNFKMEITKKFTDPLTRQANDAVRISTRSPPRTSEK